MTNSTPEQPKRNGYNPITLENVQGRQPDPFFQNLDTPSSRTAGAVLFLFIYSMSGNRAVAAPLITLILLACLLLRMTPRQRSLTAAPLTFSAVRLAWQFAGPLGIWQYAMPAVRLTAIPQWQTGSVWLPLFLSTYLFFTSSVESYTGRMVFWYSIAVLLSGLLPGEGYAVVCAMLYCTLFFVVLVTILIDLNGRPDARPVAMPPQPAGA
ncbi:MAG TPA: hypothetical protein VMJ35_08090 [Dongiaceae bacterium]|nr:hypothetical protein [Dongiaceae bacterium]